MLNREQYDTRAKRLKWLKDDVASLPDSTFDMHRYFTHSERGSLSPHAIIERPLFEARQGQYTAICPLGWSVFNLAYWHGWFDHTVSFKILGEHLEALQERIPNDWEKYARKEFCKTDTEFQWLFGNMWGEIANTKEAFVARAEFFLSHGGPPPNWPPY